MSSNTSTSRPPPKTITHTEVASSSQAKGKQKASISAPLETLAKKKPIFGINSVKYYGKYWFKRIRPTKYMHEMAIDELALKGKHLPIWEASHKMEWEFVFNNPSEANVSLIREFYANWDVRDEENLVPIRGRFIDLSLSPLCKFLGARSGSSPTCDL